MRDDVAVGAVLEVVHGALGRVGAADRLLTLLDGEALLEHLALQVEEVHVDLGPLFQVLPAQDMVDAVGGDGAVADGGGQQVRADDVAAGEDAGLARDLVVLVGGDHAAAVVELFQAGEIDGLADGGDDQVGRHVLLGAFLDLDVELAADELGLALATRSAVARPSAPLTTPTGSQTAADVRCLRPGPARSRACWPASCRCRTPRSASLRRPGGRRCRRRPGPSGRRWHLRQSVGLVVLDVAETARHGGDVDRGVAAADDHHALADVAHAAVVEGLAGRRWR